MRVFLKCHHYSIAVPRKLFDLGIDKNYSAKLCFTVLVPRLIGDLLRLG